MERYDVQGPVATLMTTTASDVDPELLNRCFVFSVDENPEQTEAIQQRQREAETIDAMLDAEDADEIRKLHHNAQRLLDRFASRILTPINFASPSSESATAETRPSISA